jgi:hypothetical protein
MTNLPENHNDISDHMKASPSDDHIHPVNRGVHPGTAKASDWEPGGPEVPARAERERVNPNTDNSQRRTPLIDVTAITSGSGNSHIAEPPPRKL